MSSSYSFANIQILNKAGSSLKRETVSIKDRVIKSFGSKSLQHAERLKSKAQKA